jgi:hypothetical protein
VYVVNVDGLGLVALARAAFVVKVRAGMTVCVVPQRSEKYDLWRAAAARHVLDVKLLPAQVVPNAEGVVLRISPHPEYVGHFYVLVGLCDSVADECVIAHGTEVCQPRKRRGKREREQHLRFVCSSEDMLPYCFEGFGAEAMKAAVQSDPMFIMRAITERAEFPAAERLQYTHFCSIPSDVGFDYGSVH